VEDLDIAKQINDVEQQIRIASANEAQAQEESEADRIRRDLASMVAEFSYDRTIAQVHTALTNLYTSVGVDLVPPNADTEDLGKLSERVKGAIAGWEAGQLPDIAVALPAASTFAAPAGGVAPASADAKPSTAAPASSAPVASASASGSIVAAQ
jgi:hypothetical protein